MHSATAAEVKSHKTILMAIYNLKGGVAKTTSTLELGYLLSKAGLKVLLVDADMQANLTTKFIYSTCISEHAPMGEYDTASAGDIEASVEAAYDEMWEQIQVSEAPRGGELRAFHHVLQQFTAEAPQFHRDDLERIKPFEARLPNDGQILHLIAGHLTTNDYDDAIGAGFTDDIRRPIPGLVTNILREFAEQKKYDLVIFDLGPYLSPVARAVLLGVDYITSPFRCERDCVTAAQIVSRKLRDLHKRNLAEEPARRNPHCVLEIRDWYDGYAGRQDPGRLAAQVSAKLKCFPVFIGAFPVAVAIKKGPTADSEKYIKAVFLAYTKSLPDYYRLFSTTNSRTTKSPEPDFDSLQTLFVENSVRVGMQATSAKGGVPCVSWYGDSLSSQVPDKLRAKGLSSEKRFELLSLQSQIPKALKISRQYGKIFIALLNGMRLEDKEYLTSKLSLDILVPQKKSTVSASKPRPSKKAPTDGSATVVFASYHRTTRHQEKRHQVVSAFIAQWDPVDDDADLKKALAESRKDARRKTQFEDMIKGYGLILEDNPGQGNCFFYALADQLTERAGAHPALAAYAGYDHVVLRALTTKGLSAQTPEELAAFYGSPQALINQMAKDRTWANDFAISTIARVLGITIVLINSNGNPPTIIDGGRDAVVYLGYEVGMHFQSARGNPSDELVDFVARIHHGAAAPERIILELDAAGAGLFM
jgi:cellulose biosynthesis protein BcsQ